MGNTSCEPQPGAGHVEEIRVATTEAVALDDVEDLGVAWAFQVEPDRILLLGRIHTAHPELGLIAT